MQKSAQILTFPPCTLEAKTRVAASSALAEPNRAELFIVEPCRLTSE